MSATLNKNQEETSGLIEELSHVSKANETSSINKTFPFKMELVIVCDGYADFLAHTLPLNKHFFEHMVVVTSYEDKDTRQLCEHLHVNCVPTDDLETRKGNFYKGLGINAGLEALSKTGWVLHMDADIVLPPLFREIIQRCNLDPHFLYGCDRYMIEGREQWDGQVDKPEPAHRAWTWCYTDSYKLGTRLMIGGCFVPIGFFQLWSPMVSGIMDYPPMHNSAARGDVLHAMRWPRSQRGFLPEIITYHLASKDSKHASNWGGRTTAPFVR